MKQDARTRCASTQQTNSMSGHSAKPALSSSSSSNNNNNTHIPMHNFVIVHVLNGGKQIRHHAGRLFFGIRGARVQIASVATFQDKVDLFPIFPHLVLFDNVRMIYGSQNVNLFNIDDDDERMANILNETKSSILI